MTNWIETCKTTTSEQLADLHREDSLEQLVILKGDLMFERGCYIGKTDPHDDDLWPSDYPSPEELVVTLSEYIEAVEQLIAKREQLEGRTVDDIEYPEGFIEACDLVYEAEGPIYKACEMLGCWVFSSTKLLYISGPHGVVIATGELVHFHIPSLYFAIEEGAPTAENIERAVGQKASVIAEHLFDENGPHVAYPTPARYWV